MRHTTSLLVLGALGMLTPRSAIGQNNVSDERDATLTALRIDQAPTLDGKIEEPFWMGASTTPPFRHHRSGTLGELSTTGRIVYDDTAVYVFMRCEEPQMPPVVRSNPKSDTEINADDAVEIFFDPGGTGSRYFQAILNTAGHHVVGHNGIYHIDGTIESEVLTRDQYWQIEVRIPWSTVGHTPRPGDIWGMNVYRTRHARPGDDRKMNLAWQPTGKGYREPQHFGTAVFGTRDPLLQPTTAKQRNAIREAILAQADREANGQADWSPEDFNAQDAHTRSIRLMTLRERIAVLDEPLLVADGDAVTDEPIFPWTVPTPEQLDPVIDVAACPGEFEPASITLFATRDLRKITARMSALNSQDGHRLPASVVDIRQVLCWYQSGWAHVTRTGRTLVPELLVHDAALIDVDYLLRENILNFHRLPQDTDVLMPFDLKAFTGRQLWLTFKPPADTEPGLYGGWLDILEDGVELTSVPVRLRVYPFELSPSRLKYSLYYRLRPSRTDNPWATMERMEQEIRNQIEHGINMPSTYIGTESLDENGPRMQALEELTRIYRDLGLIDHPLILVTMAIGTQSTSEQLENVRAMARSMVAWAETRGYSEVYFQAKDEASPEVMKQERPAMQAVHDAGAKVFVACTHKYFDAVGDILDMPVVSGGLRPELAPKVHAAGHRIFSYGNPQAGVELPLTYRRNYGLKLWAAGYDGAFNYEYQYHHVEGAYDDFREDHYRNHIMAYPARLRPIDTRQWEGWREGVDDVRYLSTLLDHLDRLEASRRDQSLLIRQRQWLNSITGDEPLDTLRSKMVGHILEVRKALEGNADVDVK